MLICIECQSSNPEDNKFCQKCGSSLHEKYCSQCHQRVAFGVETCPHCSASNAVYYNAIVKVANSTHIENTKYLDRNQRYRLVSCYTAAPTNSNAKIYTVRVVDTRPLQPTGLFILQQEKPEVLAQLSTPELVAGSVAGSTTPTINSNKDSLGACPPAELPTLALAYLRLSHLTPAVPKIHAAWLAEDAEIIVISDRHQCQNLVDIWEDEPQVWEQILHFYDRMAQLWEELAKVNCASSLLVQENLLLDEDEHLWLAQLIPDEGTVPQLQNLAQIWEELLQVKVPALTNLIEQLKQGEIQQIYQLRSRLDQIAFELEPIAPTHNSNTFLIIDEDVEADLIEDIEQIDQLIGLDQEDDEISTIILPMQLQHINYAGATDIGKQREHNEDYFEINTNIQTQSNLSGTKIEARGLYIVCDGMGGHSAGEVASKMAIQTLQTYFRKHWNQELPDQNTIVEGILQANQTLYQENLKNSRSGTGRMGTTLVMALVHNTRVAIAHVGDSRAYLISNKNGLRQLTIDHEVGQREIRRGVEPEIAYGRPDAYQLTQALGPRDRNSIKPEVQYFDIKEDCLILLCSDGISDNDLIEEYWQELLAPLINRDVDLEKGVERLINFANEHNGHDNITNVLIRLRLQPNFESKLA